MELGASGKFYYNYAVFSQGRPFVQQVPGWKGACES